MWGYDPGGPGGYNSTVSYVASCRNYCSEIYRKREESPRRSEDSLANCQNIFRIVWGYDPNVIAVRPRGVEVLLSGLKPLPFPQFPLNRAAKAIC